MSEAIEHCRQTIAAGDEDLWLSLHYASEQDAARLAAIFAFQVELRRIPHLVSEPPPGEIRLQWWRDALDEVVAGGKVRSHPVVQALASSGAIDRSSRDCAERLIDARARLLYEKTFASLESLDGFIKNAEAPLATIAFGAVSSKANDVEAAGGAYALAKFASVLAPQLSGAAGDLAAARYAMARSTLSSLDASASGRIAYLALTGGHTKRRDGRQWPLAKRAVLFRAMLTGRF